MPGVTETNIGVLTNSGSAPSSVGGQTVTAAMTTAGWQSHMHEGRQDFSYRPLVGASKGRRCSAVMFVVLMAIPR